MGELVIGLMALVLMQFRARRPMRSIVAAAAIAPLLALLVHTGWVVWRRRREVIHDTMLLGTLFAVALVLLGDNLLKVGLRQPYPGIVGFFIWSLLLARLSALEKHASKATDPV